MSALFSHASDSMKWRTITLSTLAFWVSGSLVLDFIVMPGLYAVGMMQEPNFAIAGHSLFGIFNHIELLCASVVLTGVLVMWQSPHHSMITRRMMAIAAILFAIPMLYTYLFTPMMTQLGVNLDWFAGAQDVPQQMTQMHGAYFGLELIKLVLGGVLLGALYGDRLADLKGDRPSELVH